MTVSSRQRINAALIGLLVLVLAAWLVQTEFGSSHGSSHPNPPAVTDTRR